MFKGMRKFAFAVAAAAAIFVIPTSAFSQSIQIGPGGVRIDDGRGWPMRGIAACLRKQGQARGAGRRKLPQIPGNLPKASSTRCVRRTAGSLPEQRSVGRTRRRELS